MRYARNIAHDLIFELTITLVAIVELLVIFPPALSPVATPVPSCVAMSSLPRCLSVAER